jgi:hypothetical protein
MLYTSHRGVVYGIVTCCLFGATLALSFGSIGIMPAQLFIAFFALRTFNLVGPKKLGDVFSLDRPGFWLLCNCLWAVGGAIVLPRLLGGSTLVFPIDRADADGPLLLKPLAPVSGNFSQSIYCVSDVAVYCCMYSLLKYRGAYRTLANALFLLTFLDVLAGVIDIATHAVGVDVLGVIKTAQYAMLTGEEMNGMVRISGTFPETSAFAGFTLPLFVFCLNLWVLGYRPRLSGVLTLAAATMLLLSTSGTAYAGLGGYALVLLFSRPGLISRAAIARKHRMWLMAVCAGVLGTLYIILFLPGVADAITQLFRSSVLEKADSDSGIERMSWNTQGMTNFIDTYGIGVGLGSIRASSFVVATVASLGVVGTVCYGLFLGKSLLVPVPAHYPFEERAICYAARHSIFSALIGASLSSGMFELGTLFYLLIPAAGALAPRAPQRVLRREGVNYQGNS